MTKKPKEDQSAVENILEYIPCPKCGSFSFIEYTTRDCWQWGVRLRRGNVRDYEHASAVDLREGEIINSYECEECNTEYVLDFEMDKLKKAAPGDSSEWERQDKTEKRRKECKTKTKTP